MVEVPLGVQPAQRYAVEAELARGGMGVVYRALDRASGRHVALKRLLGGSASRAHLLHLFQREYHTLKQLQHPRIIEVYDYGTDAEGPYYTMELLDGRDLRELAPLPYAEACSHLRDVASSLALLHARRLLHRDLNGRNVRLTGDGRSKLLDFGALATFGVTGQVVGTPPGVPPEALHGQPLDQRADLYALGGLAYYLLTGRHAYPASSLQALPELWRRGAPPAPSAIVAAIPRELDELVMTLLSLDPTNRPASAAEVIDRLNAIAGLPSERAIDVGQSYLSTPKLVGREHELERVHRACERIVEGHAQTLVIEGELGSGKTRLLEEMTVAAQLGGATVLRVDAELQHGPYAVARGLTSALLSALPELAVELGAAHAGVLGQVLPEVREAFPDVPPDDRSVDRSEQRVRIQTALASWLESVASRRPLVIAVDNANAADEPSLALCAGLAKRAAARGLGVIVTCTTGESSKAQRTLEMLRQGATRITLARLGAADTIALVRALFGDADNSGRLGQWLHDRTDGNPSQSIALAAQLIRDGQIRYQDGAWLLHSELSPERFAQGMKDVLERRLARLSDGARRLADAASILRGRFSIEQCLALTDAGSDDVFRWLDELVGEGVVIGVDGEFQLGQRALHTHLSERLPEARRRELHRRAGELLLASEARDAIAEIDAGWHLLRAGDELRGALLLASAGGRLVTQIEGLALAAPALEAALEVFERRGASKWMMLNVLEALTAAGWYVDRRYAALYGERTLTLALELTGLQLAARLSPMLGKRVAFFVGTTFAALRHRLAQRKIEVERFKSFKGMFAPLIGTAGIMIGVAANSFDPESARRLLGAACMMSAFPEDHIVAVMFDYLRYYAYASEGRLCEGESLGTRVVEWFARGENLKVLGRTGEEAARAISGGQMLGIALFTALSGRPEALAWAERLEGLGLSFYRMMASQARFVYHVSRGELSQATVHREQLELNAIAGGTTWQTSIIVPIALGTCAAATGDAVRLRQAAEDLEHTATEIPTLAPIARLLRARYELLRDRAHEALPVLESLAANELRASEHLLWAVAHGALARALLAAGRPADALAVSRDAIEKLGADEPRHGALRLDLLVVQALAAAETGEPAAAAAQLDATIARCEASGVPLLLALLHESRTIVARHLDDAAGFAAHLRRFEHWARLSENPALMTRCKRMGSSDPTRTSLRVPRDVGAETSRGAHASAVRTLLDRHDGMERVRAALRWMLDDSGASRGYLFLGAASELRLAAQHPEDGPPPPTVFERVQSAARTVLLTEAEVEDSEDATVAMEGASSTGPLDRSISELAVQQLVLLDGDQPKVIGVLALSLDPHAGPVRRDVLQAIAQSLQQVAV